MNELGAALPCRSEIVDTRIVSACPLKILKVRLNIDRSDPSKREGLRRKWLSYCLAQDRIGWLSNEVVNALQTLLAAVMAMLLTAGRI